MKRPSFLYGVGVALVIALAAGAVFATLAPLAGPATTLRLMIPAMGLAYLFCLLRRSADSTGRITTLVLWFVVSAITWFFSPPIAVYVLVHAVMLWLVRSLYFHSSLFPALLDLGLSALSLSAATWALTRSGSVFLAAWCFFLAQAAFVVIPTRLRARLADDVPATATDAFDSARRRADAALKQLFTR
jgi:hypothetical protein